MCLPIKICSSVAPELDGLARHLSDNTLLSTPEHPYSHLIWRPDVKVHRLDLADMRAHTAMNARASNTEEYTSEIISVVSTPTNASELTHRFQEAHLGSSFKGRTHQSNSQSSSFTHHCACSPHILYSQAVLPNHAVSEHVSLKWLYLVETYVVRGGYGKVVGHKSLLVT